MCLLVLFWAGTGCLFLFSFVSTNNYFLCSQTLWVFVVICSFLTGSQVSYNDYSCVRLSLGFIRLLSHVARPHHCRTSTEPEQSLGESLLMFSWFLSNVLQLEQNTFIATHKIPWPAASNGHPIFTGIQRKVSCHPLPGSPPKARAWPCDIRCKSEWLVKSMYCGGVIWGPPSSFTCIPFKNGKMTRVRSICQDTSNNGQYPSQPVAYHTQLSWIKISLTWFLFSLGSFFLTFWWSLLCVYIELSDLYINIPHQLMGFGFVLFCFARLLNSQKFTEE